MKSYLTKHKTVFILGMVLFVLGASLLMVSFSFQDLFALNYVPNFFFDGNIYTWVHNNKQYCIWLDATYPPLYYFTTGLYLKIIQFLKIIPTSFFSQNLCPVGELLYNKVFLFWVKFPLLVFHIFSAYIFSKLFIHNQKKWFWLWLLNPIALFVTLIEGQFEIIPTFFLLAAILAAKKDYKLLSAVLLGIGGAYKNFPFLLLIPFAWIINKKNIEKIKYIVVSFIPYISSSLMVTGSDYSKSLTFSENFKMLDLGFNIGQAKVSIYILLYALLFLNLIYRKKQNVFNDLLKYGFLFYLIYFLTAFWFVQRLLFLTPLLILVVSKNRKLFKLLPLIYINYFVYVLVMFPGLFDHSLLRSVIILPNFDYQRFNFELIKSIVVSTMDALFIYLGIEVFISKNNKEEISLQNKDVLIHSVTMVFYLVTIALLAYFSVRQPSF